MKKLLFAVTTLAFFQACSSSDDHERAAKAKFKVRIPILEEVTVKVGVGAQPSTTFLRPVNEKHPEIPLFVELTKDSDPFNEVLGKIDIINEENRGGEFIEVVNQADIGSYQLNKSIRICYTGDAHAAVKFITGLTDSVISEMFILHAYRVGKGKFNGEFKKLSKDEEAEIPVPKIWKEWKGLAGAILTVSSSNDGGDEFTPAVITQCKGGDIDRSGAKILATDIDEKNVAIALDGNGTPRIDGNTKTFPTIKDFEDGADTFFDQCYQGSEEDTKILLESLVGAADGDGDSFAELVSIKVNKKSKVITVNALITDEGGLHDNEYTFKPCGS